MIDARFSAEAFAALGPKTAAAEGLSEALQIEIMNEARAAVEGTIRRVVERLRAMGHDLHEMERRGPPDHPSCDYSFLPASPSHVGPFLGVSINFSALVLYSQVDPAPTTVVEHKPVVETPGGDAVPF